MAYPDRFKGKVAVVTGGTTGIGRAIARQIVRDGGKVVIGARHDDLFPEIIAELGNDKCHCQKCDVRIRADVDALIQAAYDTFGSFDIMVGNAGVNLMKSFLEFTEEETDVIMDTNFKGMFNCTQAAGLAFVAHGTKGSIVNTSSINIRCACPNSTVYAASKGAIYALTRGASVELAEYGIRCNCVAPGSTDTPMNGEIARGRFPNYTAPKLSIPRMADPMEIANVACFLASDDASYVTGEVYFAVGGWGTK